MKKTIRTIRDTGLLPEGAAILDITASGHYWRTSLTEEASVISGTADGLTEQIWQCGEEKDDYDVLPALSEALEGIETVITFNGHSFDLPYLRHKYEVYGLPDPLVHRKFEDLYLIFKPLKRICGLPSARLDDYYRFTKIHLQDLQEHPSDNAVPATDALKTLAALSLFSYLEAFEGKADFERADLEDGHLYMSFRLKRTCPHELSVHDTVYHVRLSGRSMQIGMPVENGRIRIYHTDLKNYVYLPDEGYAIHKSVAKFVDSSRKQPVTRENCFHYAAVNETLCNDPKWCEKAAGPIFQYLRSR